MYKYDIIATTIYYPKKINYFINVGSAWAIIFYRPNVSIVGGGCPCGLFGPDKQLISHAWQWHVSLRQARHYALLLETMLIIMFLS